MKVKVGDVVEFELAVGSLKTIQTKKLVETKSHFKPSNEGPYHSARAYDERDVPDFLTEISIVSDVGENLLGMTEGEVKKYHRNGKSSEIKVISIKKEFEEDLSTELATNLKDETLNTASTTLDPKRTDINKRNEAMIVESILECIHSMEFNYGFNYTIKYLIGAYYKKFIQYGHHKDPFFGVLHFMNVKNLEQIVHRLIEEDFLEYQDVSSGFYGQVITVSDIGKTWLDSKFDLAFSFTENTDFDIDLYNDLQILINKIKQSKNLTYPLLSTKSLKEICTKKPKTKDEIRSISGIGDFFMSEYAESFLELVKKHS